MGRDGFDLENEIELCAEAHWAVMLSIHSVFKPSKAVVLEQRVPVDLYTLSGSPKRLSQHTCEGRLHEIGEKHPFLRRIIPPYQVLITIIIDFR